MENNEVKPTETKPTDVKETKEVKETKTSLFSISYPHYYFFKIFIKCVTL